MSYWNESDTTNRIGYNKDGDDKVAKVNRLTNYYDNAGNQQYNHGHEVLDTATGTYGYRGENNTDKAGFRRDFDNMKFSKK